MQKLRIIWGVLLSFCLLLPACGSDGTNGSLSLTVAETSLSGGLYEVAAVATYSKPVADAEITITAINASTNVPLVPSDTLKTDSTGKVQRKYLIYQSTEPILIKILASMDGLSDSKIVTIPAIVATP